MNICTAPDCDGEARSSRALYCEKHYYRMRRTGRLDARPQRKSVGICVVPDCNAPDRSPLGFCAKHEARVRRHGNPDAVIAPDARRVRRGADHPGWTGDQITYSGMHLRLAATRGRATDYLCSCGQRARHWAYDHLDPDESVELVGDYLLTFSSNVTHYAPMCVPCHKRMDLANRETTVSQGPEHRG